VANLISLFNANLLPILIMAGLGFLVSKTLELDPKTVSRITFYLFSPALVFQIVSLSQLDGDSVLVMVTYAIVSNLSVGLIAFLLSRFMKFDRKVTIAVVLTTFITNAGNYGLSLNQFAFGEKALAYASIYFVVSSMLVYTLGVWVASMGQASFKESLLNLLKFPTLYALIVAIIFNQTRWVLPLPAERVVDLLASAAIPAMLLLLGMQLGRSKPREDKLPLAVATGTRLLIAPIIALGLSIPFQLEGPALQAGVTEASMPTAVMTTILATEFDASPALVSGIVTATTVLSPLTLTPLLAYLGGAG
jgi:hypothetical protein